MTTRKKELVCPKEILDKCEHPYWSDGSSDSSIKKWMSMVIEDVKKNAGTHGWLRAAEKYEPDEVKRFMAIFYEINETVKKLCLTKSIAMRASLAKKLDNLHRRLVKKAIEVSGLVDWIFEATDHGHRKDSE